MARPKGTDLTASLRVRFNANDKARLEIAASEAGLSVSEYVRRKSLAPDNHPAALSTPMERNAALVCALNKLGVNINQLARIGNSTGSVDAPALADTLAQIDTVLGRALEKGFF